MRVQSILAALTVLFSFVGAQGQEFYRLEANDQIELWTPVDQSLRRTVTIGPDGRLSLPLVGHLQAAGFTVQELESVIQSRLSKYFKETPELTVMLLPGAERAQTIYVTGEVATPGSYPFRPGLLVLHGVSMAGGFGRGPAPTSDEERQVTVRGEIARLTHRTLALSAQVARILAEVEGKPVISSDPQSAEDIKREQAILDMRRVQQASESKAHEENLALRRQITTSLREQIRTLEHRIQLADGRHSAIAKLVSKGFANEAQLLELEGDIAELRGRGHELATEVASAELDIAAEIERFRTAEAERNAVLALELREAQREQSAVRSTLDDNQKILRLLSSGSGAIAADELPPLTISIVRTVNGRPVEFEASQLTAVQPGDLVRVARAPHAPVPPSGRICPDGPNGLGGCVVSPDPAASNQRGTSHDQRSPT